MGRCLLEAVYAHAGKHDCARVYWVADKSNHAAQQLYNQVAQITDFVQYRRL
ncbi:hypothetical protein [Stenoxybacter acetivorans]|uniref:hypothetical protein n=1 Tax=Stenoxybacter acetivorans TaxID=422441 RepID=UPI000A075C65